MKTMRHKFSTYLILAFLGFFACVSSEAAARALVVSVADYSHHAGGTSLPGTKTDATKIIGLLKNTLNYSNDQIVWLHDAQATTRAILEEIEQMAVNSTEKDPVFIYFSGHGTRVVDRDGDEADSLDECLVTTDFDLGNPPTQLTDDKIQAALMRFKSKRITLVVDSCHAGTIERNITGQEGMVAKLYIPPGESALMSRSGTLTTGFKDTTPATVFTACEASEVSVMKQIDGDQQSLFTFAFVRVLERTPEIRLEDAVAQIRKWVAEQTRDSKSGKSKQTPQFNGRGDYTLRELAGIENSSAGTGSTLAVASSPTPSPEPASGPQEAAAPNSAFKVEIALKKTAYKHGELMSFDVLSDRSGHLRLYYIDASGQATLIYPNKLSSSDLIQAGIPISLPGKMDFVFRLKHPSASNMEAVGGGVVREVLLAVVSEKVFGDDDQIGQRASGGPFQALGALSTRQLRERGIAVEERPKTGHASLTYTIAPVSQ